MIDLFKKISEYQEQGKSLVLVTVVEKGGMAPSDVGKKLLYVESGEFFGTVGGGLIEYTAIETCKDVLLKRKSRTQKYVLSDKVDEVKDAVLLKMACGGDATLYYEYIGPVEHVYLFGGGHCNKALATLLLDLNFDVTIIDNRLDVLEQIDERAHKVHKNFLDFINPDAIKSRAFVVVATPSHVSDYDVMDALIINKINYQYLGMVCSKKKIKDYVKRLKEKHPQSDLSNLYAPVGLLIGGDSPLEVALSIVSEIISVYYHNDKRVTHLRDLIAEEDRYF